MSLIVVKLYDLVLFYLNKIILTYYIKRISSAYNLNIIENKLCIEVI